MLPLWPAREGSRCRELREVSCPQGLSSNPCWSTALSPTAAILVVIGKGVALLGTAIAALLSPVGLVVAGLSALVAYLLYATGAGGQALK